MMRSKFALIALVAFPFSISAYADGVSSDAPPSSPAPAANSQTNVAPNPVSAAQAQPAAPAREHGRSEFVSMGFGLGNTLSVNSNGVFEATGGITGIRMNSLVVQPSGRGRMAISVDSRVMNMELGANSRGALAANATLMRMGASLGYGFDTGRTLHFCAPYVGGNASGTFADGHTRFIRPDALGDIFAFSVGTAAGLLCSNGHTAFILTPTAGVGMHARLSGALASTAELTVGARGTIAVGQEVLAIAEIVHALETANSVTSNTGRVMIVGRLSPRVSLYGEAVVTDRIDPPSGRTPATESVDASLSGGMIVEMGGAASAR